MKCFNKIMLLFVLFSIVRPVFSQESVQSPDSDNSLDDVVERTRRMLKVSNKRAVAEWLTKKVDDRLLNSNSEELFSSGLATLTNIIMVPGRYVLRGRAIEKMRNHKDYDEYEGKAKLAWENKLGNCGENSYVTYYILKKAGAKGHIRILEAGKNGQDAHSITVWGMPPDAITNDPSTWGDGLVVDPWLGKVLDANEAMKNKWVKNNSPEVIIRDATNKHDGESENWNTIWRDEMRRTGKEIPKNVPSNEEVEDCFIATAVYGTPTNDKINILRKFRDEKLRKSFWGRGFINLYETFGPTAAYYIRGNETRKLWARINIVEPALAIAKKQQNQL